MIYKSIIFTQTVGGDEKKKNITSKLIRKVYGKLWQYPKYHEALNEGI